MTWHVDKRMVPIVCFIGAVLNVWNVKCRLLFPVKVIQNLQNISTTLNIIINKMS